MYAFTSGVHLLFSYNQSKCHAGTLAIATPLYFPFCGIGLLSVSAMLVGFGVINVNTVFLGSNLFERFDMLDELGVGQLVNLH